MRIGTPGAWLLGMALALALPSAAMSQQVSTSPGKNAVFVAQDGSLDFIEFLARIEKARRKQILAIDVFYTVSGGSCGTASQACISVVTVNGLPVQPSQFGACSPCSSLGCTVSGSFWFDAEASNQLNVPLDIRVVLADGGLQCARNMQGTLAAMLVKR